MTLIYKYLTVFLVLFSLMSKAQLTTFQNIKLDSLKQIVATTTNDSVKIYALIEIDNIIFLINDNQDLVVNLSIVDLCENKLSNSSDYDNNIWYKNKLSISYNNIATHYGNINNYDKALIFYIKSLNIEEEIGTNNTISVTCNNISGIYKKQENYKAAMEYHEKSLIIEERMRMDLKKNFELKHQADSIKHADEILIQQANNLYKEEQLKSERQRINGLILITILILSSLALVFLQLKKVRKGKLLIEEKQKEITDSINYANRLQEGMLAPFNLVQEWLLQSFILYKPKDIVSGDFYWIEKIGNRVYFAVADCTGHGIPGAFVSIICSNALSKSLYEDLIHEPSKILDNTRKIVEERFERSTSQIKDGMDISLCCLDVNQKVINWSGAMNPLWIVRKNAINIEELKPDRQPIGMVENPKQFTQHELRLEQGDSIYLFSDGYQDQFGGPNGKKYMKGKFKKFILSVQSQPMQEQLLSFDKEFNSWTGKYDQLDDVCVMGVRIT